MCASVVITQHGRAAPDILDPILAGTHDRWMAEADKVLGPVTERDATFFQRWAAIRYLSDTFPERFGMERELLEELHPFIVAEVRERLTLQVDRLIRLQQDLERLARQRGTAREVAHTARELLEALRLWYAEIEFAVGELREEDVGPGAARLLRLRNPRRIEECFAG